MANEEMLKELQATSFFKDMPDAHLEGLSGLCRLVEFPALSTIFEEYEKAKEVYIILSGEVSLAICEPDDSCRQISVAEKGDLVGWSPLVGRARLTDTAYCLTQVKALVFQGDALLDFCRDNPQFGFQFMHRAACALADRLAGTRLQLLKMCGVEFPAVQTETD